jgi:hypothetical protein
MKPTSYVPIDLDFELLDPHKEERAHEGDEIDGSDELAHEKA